MMRDDDKRFQAACAAMQGLLASENAEIDETTLAHDAVVLADALLEALKGEGK